MSGGSMDYLYSKVESAQFRVDGSSPLRMAFASHLQKVARALRAIEWNDSGDGDRGEEAAIRACIEPGAELEAAIRAAEVSRRNLEKALAVAKGESE